MKRARGSEWDRSAYITIRRRRDALLGPVTRALGRLGVPAAAVSLFGVLLAGAACWAVDGSLVLALSAFLAALACDALDGALARHRRTDSAGGKAVDHACDLATFLLVLLAVTRCPLSSNSQAALAALLAVPLLLLAIQARRRRSATPLTPTGGFLAHAFKAPIYAAFALYTAGGANLLEPAVRLANATAIGSLLLIAGAFLARQPGEAATAPAAPGSEG